MSTDKPIIGVLQYPYVDCDGDLMYEVLSPVIESLVRAGMRPIGIYPTQLVKYQNMRVSEIPPLTDSEKQDIIDSIKMCHGIIKPGAVRIYGFDRFVYQYVLENNIPYLGICAGMQVMAAHGKEYVNNIKIESSINHKVREDGVVHSVKLSDGKLKDILGADEIGVSSKHAYMVPDAGIHKVCGMSEDGVIEAIENPDCDFNFGLQWHPEMTPDDEYSLKIFDAFADAARAYRDRQ